MWVRSRWLFSFRFFCFCFFALIWTADKLKFRWYNVLFLVHISLTTACWWLTLVRLYVCDVCKRWRVTYVLVLVRRRARTKLEAFDHRNIKKLHKKLQEWYQAVKIMGDETDSLKDWLVVIQDPFHKNIERIKLQFHVAWNEHSQKVLCERT